MMNIGGKAQPPDDTCENHSQQQQQPRILRNLNCAHRLSSRFQPDPCRCSPSTKSAAIPSQERYTMTTRA